VNEFVIYFITLNASIRMNRIINNKFNSYLNYKFIELLINKIIKLEFKNEMRK
jgi:hypothetical protein